MQLFSIQVCNSQKAVGEEIARLRHAVELFKAAQTRSADSTFFEDNLGRAQRALDEAVKDNDFIYHERIPDVRADQFASFIFWPDMEIWF